MSVLVLHEALRSFINFLGHEWQRHLDILDTRLQGNGRCFGDLGRLLGLFLRDLTPDLIAVRAVQEKLQEI